MIYRSKIIAIIGHMVAAYLVALSVKLCYNFFNLTSNLIDAVFILPKIKGNLIQKSCLNDS